MAKESAPASVDARTDQINRLIEQNADRAYAVALRMTGNAADAGDVVQEAFLRAIKYMGSYDASLPFEGWLNQIIRNVYLSSLGVESRRRSVSLSAPRGDDEDSASLEDVLRDDEPGPERLAQAQADSESVRKAVAGLSPTLRMAVVLADLEGMAREDCARTLGCSLAAFDVRLHRARAQLRGILSREGVR